MKLKSAVLSLLLASSMLLCAVLLNNGRVWGTATTDVTFEPAVSAEPTESATEPTEEPVTEEPVTEEPATETPTEEPATPTPTPTPTPSPSPSPSPSPAPTLPPDNSRKDTDQVRVGLKYNTTAVDEVVTGSNKGGTIGIVEEKSGTAVYIPVKAYTQTQKIKVKTDSGYHLELTHGTSDPESLLPSLGELKTLLRGSGYTPYMLYNGNMWYICVAFYDQIPTVGGADLYGNDSLSLISSLVAGSGYMITYQKAGINSVKVYAEESTGYEPCLILSTDGTSASVRIKPTMSTNSAQPALMTYGNARYRGEFDFHRLDGGKMILINCVSVEDYLYSVVPSEMIVWAPTPEMVAGRAEGLKAQAIMARTLAYTKITADTRTKYGFHVDNTDNYQVYNGYIKTDGEQGEFTNSNDAVDTTRGIILIYNGKPIPEVYYAGNDGGFTESPDNVWGGTSPSYLPSKYDPWTTGNEWTHFNNSTGLPYTGGEMSDRLSSYILSHNGINIGEVKYINIIERGTSDRVLELLIEGTYTDALITNGTIRSAMSMKSQHFNFEIGTKVDIINQSDNSETALSARARKFLEGTSFTTQFVDDSYAVVKAGTVYDEFNKVDVPIEYRFERIRIYGAKDTRRIIITGRGHGHGVGVSQDGAEAMSFAGYTYMDIFAFYLPGVTVDKYY